MWLKRNSLRVAPYPSGSCTVQTKECAWVRISTILRFFFSFFFLNSDLSMCLLSIRQERVILGYKSGHWVPNYPVTTRESGVLECHMALLASESASARVRSHDVWVMKKVSNRGWSGQTGRYAYAIIGSIVAGKNNAFRALVPIFHPNKPTSSSGMSTTSPSNVKDGSPNWK